MKDLKKFLRKNIIIKTKTGRKIFAKIKKVCSDKNLVTWWDREYKIKIKSKYTDFVEALKEGRILVDKV